MEGKDNQPSKHKTEKVTVDNEISNPICKKIECNGFIWHKNVTVINLSGRNIEALDDKVRFPTNLLHLDLSHNKLTEVPNIILILEKLVFLNLSHNMIQYFDDYPEFCHNLEILDVSHNHLSGPPYWIWEEKPPNLAQLNLSNNVNLTKSFVDGYFEHLILNKTLVTEVDINNCRLGKFTALLGTFSKALSLSVGTEDCTGSANSLIEIPCQGLDQCYDLKSLKLCNTHIYTINPNIDMYKNLIEINLAQNDLSGLPNEFCNLNNLEICILSCNKIIYLPDDMCKMEKLSRLYLDSNVICMLPEMLNKLSHLKTLDLYDNNLESVPSLENIGELDLALNYFEEPDDSVYLDRKEKLRVLHKNRCNGRKNMVIKDDYDDESRYSYEEDDEELYDIFNNDKQIDSPNTNPPSSPEDWDSDEYWVPCHINPIPKPISPWIHFVKQKMEEGNFCPIDNHPIPIMEKIKYERMINPPVNYETDGQFDDYSGDDS